MASSALDGVVDEPTRARNQSQDSLKVMALFAGVGGFERGLELAGHQTIEAFEIDPSAQAVFHRQFSKARLNDDVRRLSSIDSSIDLVTAGFPCVDLSQAGSKRGLDGKSSGLIRQVLGAVANSKVKNLLLENVPFMLKLGRGQAMAEIVSILEPAGFAWAYRTIDVRSFGIPQRRPRVILFASRESDPRRMLFRDLNYEPIVESKPVVGLNCIGFYSTEGNTGAGLACDALPPLKPGSSLGIKSAPALLQVNGKVGTPSIADAERLQGLEPGWTEAAEGLGRNARWRLVGNAVNVRLSQWLGDGLAHQPDEAKTPEMSFELIAGKWPTTAWNIGNGRCGANVAPYFSMVRTVPISEFLTEELDPLSFRACNGFVSRAEKSSLKFPDGFLQALRKYLKSVS